jgi:hypothetical protein
MLLNGCRGTNQKQTRDLADVLTKYLGRRNLSICTITLKSVGKIYPRRWYMNGNSYSARSIHLSQLFRFKLFKLYSIFWNVLMWLKYDFMHIFIHHLSLYLTYNVSHICADTWRWMCGPIWIFDSKYRFWPWGRMTNTDFRLLLEMPTKKVLQQNMW